MAAYPAYDTYNQVALPRQYSTYNGDYYHDTLPLGGAYDVCALVCRSHEQCTDIV